MAVAGTASAIAVADKAAPLGIGSPGGVAAECQFYRFVDVGSSIYRCRSVSVMADSTGNSVCLGMFDVIASG